MFSNKYIFIYASVMVIVVAAVLSMAAMFLQPFQSRNAKIEKIQTILASAAVPSTKENAESLYQKVIVAEKLIDIDGQEVTDGRKAFDIDLNVENSRKDDYLAGKTTQKPVFPLFVCQNEGKTSYVVPLRGKGLWGPLWGYIALQDDFNTLVGAIFDHKSETAGLGAEISGAPFQHQFIGKKIFDEEGRFVSIAVVKGGVAASDIDPVHGVDAISGGTITSVGMSDMIRSGLSVYVGFFTQERKAQKSLQQPAVADTLAVGDSLLPMAQ